MTRRGRPRNPKYLQDAVYGIVRNCRCFEDRVVAVLVLDHEVGEGSAHVDCQSEVAHRRS